MASLPYITAAEAGPCDWPRLVDALAEGHRGGAFEISDQFLHRRDDVMLSRAAWIDGQGVGVKSVTVFPGNVAQDRPSVQGAMIVFDDVTGAPRALIDSALITKWKTAADSVLGGRLLARPDARNLLIIGAGSVAASLIEAYPAVLPNIDKITLWNRTTAKAQSLADQYPHVEVAQDLQTALADADIVSTATMSNTPILAGAMLRAGTHVDLIGAFTATMREADDEVLRRGRIFVDSYETTLDHIGELMIPLAAGTIVRSDVQGDFRAMVAGTAGRQNADEITVFKNGGGAHLDLMTANLILTLCVI